MKRLVLTVTGTVAGVGALLSFKTQGAPIASGPLPSAAASSSTTPTATTPSSSTASSSAAPAAPSSSSTSHTYEGQAITTRYGIVQVEATIADGRITDVAFTQLTAFDRRSEEINSQAGPQLLQETLQQQTAQVDTVSGASYTSDGYRQSLQSALDQANFK